MLNNYKSPLGYVADGKKIDSYGVDHSGFSTKDEIKYQMARQRRENRLIDNYNRQGITKDYPQYGNNFWGEPDNNYGFGSSNIAENIKRKQKQDINSVLYPETTGNNAEDYKIAQDNAQEDIFNRVFNKTLNEEGGYEDRPNKIDTATNMGFQQATLERFKQKHHDLAQGFPKHVKDLTYEQGKLIARKDYYEPYRLGEIKSLALQETMFDSFFNHSPQAPALWVQRAINQNTKMHVDEDGVFGSETINAMNKLSEDEIVKVNNAILNQRLEDYEREKKINANPHYEEYTVGLPDRFERFKIK